MTELKKKSPSLRFFNYILTSSLAVYLSSGCAKKDFPLAPQDPAYQSLKQDFALDQAFPYKVSQDYFSQDQYDQNQTDLTFQVRDFVGTNISGLSKNDFEVVENGQGVSEFDLAHQDINLGQKADIVFVVDVASSMRPTINSLKSKVQAFVGKMKDKHVQVLLCLVTFRDHTENTCDTIVEDDPSTAANENLDIFLANLAKLGTGSGGDADENQLRAVVDAAKAPWRLGSQRITILITDSGFHYLPDNKGDAKGDTPFYGDAMTALQKTQMTLFAVAPQKDGYSQNFQGNPSLVSLTKGAYFNFQDMIKGKISLESIFQTIVDRISTNYNIHYVMEKNPALDSSLPLSKRSFSLHVKGHGDYTVTISGASSNMPQGHPQYQKRWKLTRSPRHPNKNLEVLVNGQRLDSGFHLENSELVFDQTPAAGAQVQVSYDPDSMRAGISVRSLVLPESLDITTMRVYFNSREVEFEEMKLSRDLEGHLILDPAFSIYSYDDPYGIIDREGLAISVSGVVVTTIPANGSN